MRVYVQFLLHIERGMGP